jgi:primary-amine oxidase
MALSESPPTVAHPLDPLSAEELEQAVAIAREARGLGDAVRFISVETREPDKDAFLAWRDGAGPRPAREAFLVVLDNGGRRGYEAVVALDAGALVSWTALPEGVQPAIHIDEYMETAAAVKADPRFLEALERRGLTDVDAVQVDAWSVGTFEAGDRRLVRAISWVRADLNGDNVYSRPLYGLAAVVDLDTMEVVRLDDHGAGPVPDGAGGDYRDAGGQSYRTDLKPLDVVQPDGPSFALDGFGVVWQKWELRIGFHPREALVLHDIRYRDGDELRPICHRASVAELVIPYGDPNPTVHFKNAFDIGEYGLGPLVNSLALGCDCLGEIRYLDGVTNDSRGRAFTIRNAICIHEEDDGLLWKHFDDRSDRSDLARSRRLVVSCIATVGNYEYAFYWRFYQDASWELETRLTGVVHTAGWIDADRSPYSLPLAPGVVTSNHQHFFCARLDLDLDGTANTAYEVEAVSEPWGPANPDGAAFRAQRTTYARESQARRDVSPFTARRFRVENPGRRNRIGDCVAYELVPGENVSPLAQPDSQLRRRARFTDHHLWVTPYRRDERYPAGEYPNQHPGGDGLPRWTAADRPLEGEDVVLWYVFGAHHFPRLEDWPVMPVARCGFQLRPVGFFDRNPALDVPPPHGVKRCVAPDCDATQRLTPG